MPEFSSYTNCWLSNRLKLRSALTIPLGLLLCLSLVSCGHSISNAEHEPLANDYVATISNKVVVKNNLKERVKFQKGNNSEAFTLKPKENGIKLEGAQGQALSNIKVDANGKITIETSAGFILGHVSGNSSYWQIEDGEQTRVLYFLRKQVGNNYQLESANNQQLYNIESRDYGFEIKTAKGEPVYQVKIEDDRTVLLDRDNNIVLKTQSSLSPLAIACYGLNALDRHQQTALAYAVSLMAK